MIKNINIEKLQKNLKLNIKKQLFMISTGVMVALGTTGCSKEVEIPVETQQEFITNSLYNDDSVSVTTALNDKYISVYTKKNENINYNEELYSTLQTELSKNLYNKIELANIDSSFDFSRLDLNNINVLHLNCCNDNFDYSVLSNYSFDTIYVNEIGDNKDKLSSVLPYMNSKEVIVMFNYMGDLLGEYNLNADLNKNVNDLELHLSTYSNEVFKLNNVNIKSDNNINLTIGTYPFSQITEDTSINVPNNSQVEFISVDILNIDGLESLKNCAVFKYNNGTEDVISYPNKDIWNISETEKVKIYSK